MAMIKLPEDRPEFLLDLNRWTIRRFDDCWNDFRSELQTKGFGAISYAWGGWKDRTMFARNSLNPDDHQYPAFDIGEDNDKVPLSWVFPITRQEPGQSVEQFTAGDAQRALGTIGLRFVWWDWACIPQGFINPTEPDKEQYRIHPELLPVMDQEMNKMRYVYPNSKRGIIWAHTVHWGRGSELEQAIKACCNYPMTPSLTKTVVEVEDVVTKLEDANKSEMWLQSLWCFQEGVLFSHPDRHVDPPDAVFRDYIGRSLPVPSIRGEGDLADLVLAASSIASTIVLFLRRQAESPQENPFENFPAPVDRLALYFQPWCFDPANNFNVRQMLDRVVKTGLVFYTAQSPLSLLNARWNRERGKHSRLADIEVNTVIGALEVDIEIYQIEARALPADDRLPIHREGMLVELFKIYQWRMLLFATELRQPSATMKAVWSSLVEIKDAVQKVPVFTALEYFLSSAHLAQRFRPPPTKYVGDPAPAPPRVPTNQFALPILEYSRKHRYLILHGLSGFRIFDLQTYTESKPMWTKCMFYTYEGNMGHGVFAPGFKTVPFGEWEKVFGAKSVLVPVEYLPMKGPNMMPWERVNRLRFVVLNNFGPPADLNYPSSTATEFAGTFIGVVDIEGAPKLEDGTVELKEDVALF
ncbi:hypothetical protein N7517_010847 [Penicillium concentricum]|uniref:Heterokaryon incompatibility domain-containing protein n=1 Tax=Penicillium concentricum TaxID=293559 RepID=A0A9W9R9X8_9EURO|nr:uncharacterized protein N7517_010847 [Penicillium concentricum]KAJ5356238.1 hypothetical protein N7517_010847 [Penicillium concentricum]